MVLHMDNDTTHTTKNQTALPISAWGTEAAKVAANTQHEMDAAEMSELFALAMEATS